MTVIKKVAPQDAPQKKEFAQKVVELNVRYIAQRDPDTHTVQDILLPTTVTVRYENGELLFQFDKIGVEYYEILAREYAQHFLQSGNKFLGYWEKKKRYFKELSNGEQEEAYFTTRYIVSGELPKEILEAIARDDEINEIDNGIIPF